MTEKQIEIFERRAVWMIGKLLADFPMLGEEDGFAVAGNGGHESAGLQAINETNPTVPNSRGGFGWFQWTGPRRRAFEAYCARTGKDPSSDEANYAWLFLELSGKAGKDFDESRAIGALMQAKTLAAKVNAFEASYERAGVKHYESRLIWAERARGSWNAAKAAGTLPSAPTGQNDGAVGDLLAADIDEVSNRLAALAHEQFDQVTLAVALASVKRAGKLPVATENRASEGTETMETKSIFKSKTLIGILLAAVPVLFPGAAPFVLPLQDLAGVDPQATAAVTDVVNTGVQLVGLLLAAFGRFTATTKITPIVKK